MKYNDVQINNQENTLTLFLSAKFDRILEVKESNGVTIFQYIPKQNQLILNTGKNCGCIISKCGS